MPEIRQFTRQIRPNAVQGVTASPVAFGANQQGAQQFAQALSDVSNTLDRAQERRLNRIDVIEKVRKSEEFYSEAFEEFTKTQSEQDLLDPNTVRKFNKDLREKAEKAVARFKGSPDARSAFESRIESVVGDFSRQMSTASVAVQREFINKQAGDAIGSISRRVGEDTSYLPQAFLDVKDVLFGPEGLAPAMFPEDEAAFLEAAQQEIVLSAIQSHTDVGDYESARDLINDAPFVLESLPPAKQRQIIRTIDSGITARQKEIDETRNTIVATRKVAEDLGIEVSPSTLFTAATGIQQAQTPDVKIDEFARVLGVPREDMSPAMKAKIGYNIDLPSGGEVDPNKEFGPNNQLTVKGIGAKIAEPFEKAVAAKDFHNKINGAIDLFQQDGNTQALLSAMITFQKLLDEGAIVREGDIVLQRSAQGLSDRMETLIENINTGQIVGSELVSQMQSTANDFVMQALQSNKTRIDPFLQDARERGFRMLDIGLPQEAYNRIFSGVKTEQEAPTGKYSIQQIEDVAKQNGMSLQEFLESSASASGKSVEEIKQLYGININD